jgi:DNA-directed RNA polymerase specialized sigma24 family protein
MVRKALPDLEKWAEEIIRDKKIWAIARDVEQRGWMESEDFVQCFVLEVIRCVKYFDCRKKTSFDGFVKIVLRNVLYQVKREAERRLVKIDFDFISWDAVDGIQWDDGYSVDCNLYFALEVWHFLKRIVPRIVEDLE